MIRLNDLIKEKHLYAEADEKRDAVIADMELVREYLMETIDRGKLLIEGKMKGRMEERKR